MFESLIVLLTMQRYTFINFQENKDKENKFKIIKLLTHFLLFLSKNLSYFTKNKNTVRAYCVNIYLQNITANMALCHPF